MEIMDPWLPILKNLLLSRAEQAVVKRYAADPLGRSFLPIADILRSHKLVDESVELLMQGVERHPSFTVARVMLARDLLAKGLIEESWTALEGAREPLHDNVLAQKIRLKLCILLGFDYRAQEIVHYIKTHRTYDDESLRLSESLESMKFSHVRDHLIEEMKKNGVHFELPGSAIRLTTGAGPSNSHGDGGVAAEIEDSVRELANARMDGFGVVPLREIFSIAMENRAAPMAEVELDSLTLSDIYVEQGHYNKALDVNRRLLRLMPHSGQLKQKIEELSRVKAGQHHKDIAIDTHAVDKLATMEIIDTQLKFLNDLLNKI